MAALILALLIQDRAESPAQAFERGTKEARPVLLYFRSPSDGWCRKFEAETFSGEAPDPKGFVTAWVDIEGNEELVKKWEIEGIPSLVAAEPGGAFLSRLAGYRKAGEIGTWLAGVSRGFAGLVEHRKAAADRPEDPAPRRELGRIHYELGNLPASIEAFDACLVLARKIEKPTAEDLKWRAAVLVQLSDAHRSRNDPAPLSAIAQEIEEIDPDGTLDYRDNALYLKALVEHDGATRESKPARSRTALALLKEAEEKYPDSDKGDEILLWLAVLLHDLEHDAEGSGAALERLLKRHPSSPLADFARQALERIRPSKPQDKR